MIFFCKQFGPDQARHNNVQPHSAFTDPNVGTPRTPSKISQKYRFFSNWSEPLKNQKATKPHFCGDQHWHSSETLFKWRFAGGPMMAGL